MDVLPFSKTFYLAAGTGWEKTFVLDERYVRERVELIRVFLCSAHLRPGVFVLTCWEDSKNHYKKTFASKEDALQEILWLISLPLVNTEDLMQSGFEKHP